MSQTPRLLVFETHPIQYRAPVFQALERLQPGLFEVVYASDFSVRGYDDPGFGAKLSWDVPLLSGYSHSVLGNDAPDGIGRWSGLTGKGVDRLIAETRPAAVLLSSMSYAFNLAAYWAALRRGIPVWIRMETQDTATERGPMKRLLRSLVYRLLYKGVSKAFYIGRLSREHLLRHGLREDQLAAGHYCTPDPLAPRSPDEKEAMRAALRSELGIPADHVVVAFFGKFIAKKDPEIVLRALSIGTPAGRATTCLMVGSGELEPALRELAATLESRQGIRTVFAGFINQSKLPAYYLASDIVVLPSRRMGETWGLVVNEALQAGCGVVMSEAVGSHRDFGGWERVRVIPIEGERELVAALAELAALPRAAAWASAGMRDYSIDATAKALRDAVLALPAASPAAG